MHTQWDYFTDADFLDDVQKVEKLATFHIFNNVLIILNFPHSIKRSKN